MKQDFSVYNEYVWNKRERYSVGIIGNNNYWEVQNRIISAGECINYLRPTIIDFCLQITGLNSTKSTGEAFTSDPEGTYQALHEPKTPKPLILQKPATTKQTSSKSFGISIILKICHSFINSKLTDPNKFGMTHHSSSSSSQVM